MTLHSLVGGKRWMSKVVLVVPIAPRIRRDPTLHKRQHLTDQTSSMHVDELDASFPDLSELGLDYNTFCRNILSD